jgi:hypothetical protein
MTACLPSHQYHNNLRISLMMMTLQSAPCFAAASAEAAAAAAEGCQHVIRAGQSVLTLASKLI